MCLLAQVGIFDTTTPALPVLRQILVVPQVALSFDQSPSGNFLVLGCTMGITVIDVRNLRVACIIQEFDTASRDRTSVTPGFLARNNNRHLSLFTISLGKKNRVTEYDVKETKCGLTLKSRRVGIMLPGYVPWTFQFFNDNLLMTTNSGHTFVEVFAI